MPLIKPRLTDHHKIAIIQEEVDFAIPFLDEDIPFYLDPFLLWKSPSQQDNSLHTAITNSFNHLGYLLKKGKEGEAIDILVKASECYEAGLGDSRKRKGKPIGKKTALNILTLFKAIPQIQKSGFVHFEEIQLYVDHIAEDRVSDFACSFIKSFLIDFTIEQSEKYHIPIEKFKRTVYDYKNNRFKEEEVYLPYNPENLDPIVLVPKRWLRYIPWVNYDDYYQNFFIKKHGKGSGKETNRIALLNYNRENYDLVQVYIKIKERQARDCKNDPLFKPIPALSTKRKLSTILKLQTGRSNSVDKIYENTICQLMASLVYPQLDFADIQSRTESGILIRDLIFYNNRTYDFLKDIYEKYGCQQIVMELKNVCEIEGKHINQLNRYMKDQFGRFGIIITRNQPPRRTYTNTIDLWSGQRKCVIFLTDDDLKTMCLLYESRNRNPIDVIKMKWVQFTRDCPG